MELERLLDLLSGLPVWQLSDASLGGDFLVSEGASRVSTR
jgi:hypothetical protein